MHVIRRGPDRGPVRFDCDRCDSIFEADDGEYSLEDDGDQCCNCPVCDNSCKASNSLPVMKGRTVGTGGVRTGFRR